MLKNLKVAVYVTGGIAAYKIPDLVRRIIKQGAEVRVAMTPAAQQFVMANTFHVLTKYPVLSDNNVVNYPDPVGHIHLADWADLAVMVPATASSLAKLANGIADNEVMASLLAVNQPTLLVPAMNEKMWQHPATQRNIQQLRADGYYIMEPAVGFLAEGYEGKGRMPEVEEILAAIQSLATFKKTSSTLDLAGRRVLISAGGTQEAIDPVRYISNRSTGKMGIAIAHVAQMAGANVCLVRTQSTLQEAVMPGIQQIVVESAQDLYQVMHEEILTSDLTIMAAAVSDYRVAQVADQKIKKTAGESSNQLQIDLIENPDILKSLPKDRSVVVGFAAETHQVLEFAQNKLERKGADMIVANDVSQKDIGFGSDQNQVILVSKDQQKTLEKMSKFEVAYEILLAASRIQK